MHQGSLHEINCPTKELMLPALPTSSLGLGGGGQWVRGLQPNIYRRLPSETVSSLWTQNKSLPENTPFWVVQPWMGACLTAWNRRDKLVLCALVSMMACRMAAASLQLHALDSAYAHASTHGSPCCRSPVVDGCRLRQAHDHGGGGQPQQVN
eukprot:888111-Pelagomonas_calceolata.AAC.3